MDEQNVIENIDNSDVIIPEINYIDYVDREVKEYFDILEPEYPEWLNEYINTDILLKQQHISTTCGTIYSDLFESDFSLSSLDHSIGVALICWHFTHDKKDYISRIIPRCSNPSI